MMMTGTTAGVADAAVVPALLAASGQAERATREVTRVAKPNDGRSVVVDWFRLVCHRSVVGSATKMLRELLGGEKHGSGKFFCESSTRYEHGASVHFDHAGGDAEWAVVDLPAKAIEAMGRKSFEFFAREIMMQGGRCTRLDVAIDFVGDKGGGRNLIEDVLSACRAREMCGAKCFALCEGVSYTSGELGKTVYVGKRGKLGSGRFLRVYDKGLETRLLPKGEWTRYEVEFTGDVAAQAAVDLFRAGMDDSCLVAAAFGAFDFRRVTGRRELTLRPRLSWWQAIIGTANLIRWRVRRTMQDAAKWCQWVRRCVGRQLSELAEAIDTDVSTVLGMICTGGKASGFTRRGRGVDVVAIAREMLYGEGVLA
jgi:DNA relaxase NicK